MNVGLYINGSKKKSIKAADRVKETLNKAEINCFISENASDFEEENLDAMLVLGGDGTILNVVSLCAKRGVPILGINTGNVGFLTEVEVNETEKCIDMLVSGKYTIEERMMLTCTAHGKEYFALNDVVLSRSKACDERSHVVRVSAEVSGNLLDHYVCDGVICSTPTGSTAYSLSAGGAVLDPKIQAIQIVAICPHSLHAKPIVLSGNEKITFTTPDTMNLIVDGNILFTLAGGSIEVERSRYNAKFITVGKYGFYKKLVNKLSKWSS